ncbi:hypothetical protein IEQ34_012112 [Dendrobium chrysotoxum]|uniref:Uncharacterized protein n=1 Tax=Dendrobium chrysotoxum TaxID=161865 RepID=A0AAV7GUE3_DENCH|nr:hypothetical protein IEQ34_012112 [Dendrobium chrysotoxum]
MSEQPRLERIRRKPSSFTHGEIEAGAKSFGKAFLRDDREESSGIDIRSRGALRQGIRFGLFLPRSRSLSMFAKSLGRNPLPFRSPVRRLQEEAPCPVASLPLPESRPKQVYFARPRRSTPVPPSRP